MPCGTSLMLLCALEHTRRLHQLIPLNQQQQNRKMVSQLISSPSLA